MLNYPLDMSFKFFAINPQVRITDAGGQVVAYIKQKAFKLKEDIKIFSDEQQQQQLFQIKADRIIDFSANYSITRPDGRPVGSIKRKGARSILKATYLLFDANGSEVGMIQEENAWVKVMDALIGEVPVLGIFSGLMFNPAYLVNMSGTTLLRL